MFWLILFLFFQNVYPEELWKQYETPQTIECIATYGEYVWIGTKYQGLFRLNKNDGSLKYEIFNIQELAIDKDGVVYAGSNGGGVAVLKDGEWVRYYKGDNGLIGNDIEGISIGKDNSIWLAINGADTEKVKGVQLFNQLKFQTYLQGTSLSAYINETKSCSVIKLT